MATCKYCGYNGGVGMATHEKACKKRTDEERKLWLENHTKMKAAPSAKNTNGAGKMVAVTFATAKGTVHLQVPETMARKMIQDVLG